MLHVGTLAHSDRTAAACSAPPPCCPDTGQPEGGPFDQGSSQASASLRPIFVRMSLCTTLWKPSIGPYALTTMATHACRTSSAWPMPCSTSGRPNRSSACMHSRERPLTRTVDSPDAAIKSPPNHPKRTPTPSQPLAAPPWSLLNRLPPILLPLGASTCSALTINLG